MGSAATFLPLPLLRLLLHPLLLLLLQLALVPEVRGECRMSDSQCEFWLEVSHRLTMMHHRDAVYAHNGRLYLYDVPEAEAANHTAVDPAQVVVADGWEVQKLVITVNGSMPGPPIEVYENQTVVVHVKNLLRSEAVTVHWHGLHQHGSPWMDGVPFVTQCPIQPGNSFTYRFQAYPRGTFWYHSHSGAQLGMGLVGAFIIREKTSAPALEEHIMMLQDWNHDWDANVAHLRMDFGSFQDRKRLPTTDSLEGGHFSNFLFQSGLINGRGRYFGESHNYTSQTPLTVYLVESGQQYRFRVVGAGNLYPFRVSIDDHLMTVIASDGYEFQPVLAESLIIHPGERFDFILEANQTAGNYWIRAETLEVNVVNHLALAILRYNGSAETDPVELYEGFRPCTAMNRCTVVNCPFSYFPEDQYTDCLHFNDLESLHDDPPPGISEDDEVEDIFLNFAFPGTTKTPASTNGVQFMSPTVPPLTQPQQFNTACQPKDNCGEQRICHCSQALSLQHGKTYQIVMLNMGVGKGWGHPMHMHGHSFHVVKMAFPTYNQTTGRLLADSPDIDCRGNVTDPAESFCNRATWANDSWAGNGLPGLDLVRPPRKDTIMVPTGGYTVLRIKADNPGVWFMHCHIELHNLDGMALMLNESFQHQPKPPAGFPVCADYAYDVNAEDIEMEPKSSADVSMEGVKDCKGHVEVEVFWGVVGALIAVVCFLLVIVVCMCRQRQMSSKEATVTEPTTQKYYNKAFTH